MKQCPQCRRAYADETLNFCLDDGEWLRAAAEEEPVTAVLNPGDLPSEEETRHFAGTNNAVRPSDPAPARATPKAASRRRLYFRAALVAVVIAAAFFGFRFIPYGGGRHIESIAVMPFTNESGNADVEYLSDGMTETLINSLSQIPNLSVKSRSSVFRYKGNNNDLKTVASELSVQAFLTGRIVQRGDRLALNVELIDARTENTIWGNRYERRISELVALQNEITRDVSGRLKTDLTGQEQARIAKNYTANAEAYQLYLKGRFFYSTFSESGFRNGIDLFQQAIAIDPNYALAYSGLADCYFGLSDQFEPPRDVLPKMRVAAEKAVALDPSLAEAHASLGLVKMYQDRDWAGAENEFRQAISLNPTYAPAHFFYARMLSWLERHDEAVAAGERAVQLDRFSSTANANLGYLLMLAGRFDEALAHLEKTLQMEPNSTIAHSYLGMTYLRLDQFDKAVAASEKAAQLTKSGRYLGGLGYAYAAAGQRENALRVLEEMRQLKNKQHVSSFYIAAVYSGLGDKDKAFQYLEDAFAEGSDPLPSIRVNVFFDELRSDPRFAALLKRLNMAF